LIVLLEKEISLFECRMIIAHSWTLDDIDNISFFAQIAHQMLS
jgi:hypothetical protein